jgi:hypothetical protein
MLTFVLTSASHLMAAVRWVLTTQDAFSKSVLDQVAAPLLTSAQFLIPAAVAISGIHKMMEHRESGGSFLIDMVTKGGGAVLVLQLIKSLTGVA